MTSSVQLYEALATAPDDKTRAKLIAEAFERLEERYPQLHDVATQAHLRETELLLKKEIEQARSELRSEIEQVRSELRSEIEQLRSELRSEIEQLRSELRSEIEQLRSELRSEIEQLRSDLRIEIAQVKTDLIKWIVPMMFAQVVVIAALVKLL